MIVCRTCLMAIESHEGHQKQKQLNYFDYDEEFLTCEWCEEECEISELTEI